MMYRTARADDVRAIVALVQSAYRGEASRAGWTTGADLLDGQRTDADAVAAAFTWAAERARAGAGPALIELVSMRMCGHAHHDDMLQVGQLRLQRRQHLFEVKAAKALRHDRDLGLPKQPLPLWAICCGQFVSADSFGF